MTVVTEIVGNENRTWLITGVAGFIGSNLLEALLGANQKVVGLDNFETGHQYNLDDVRATVTPEQWRRFRFIEGDICDEATCRQACAGVDVVLHQAALGSVPRSIEDPLKTNATNITGFANMLVAARDEKVGRFVYAASSSTYGDHPGLPKQEDHIGRPLSPYAVTKYANELYADVFARTYGLDTIGLRYFNIFGPRQDPAGAYAAVIPKWIGALLESETVFINGDGETSRDFCYIDNAVQANLLAGVTGNGAALNQVYNVAVGERTSLNELYAGIETALIQKTGAGKYEAPVHQDFRAGDVRHSLADISRAQDLLGYQPSVRIGDGLQRTVDWFVEQARATAVIKTAG